MMNEFPSKYLDVMREASGSDTPPVNVTEYLEYLDYVWASARRTSRHPAHHAEAHLGPVPGDGGAGSPGEGHRGPAKEDSRFHMEGGSWTNNLSWVRGYGDVLGPMEQVSALFAKRPRACPPPSRATATPCSTC